MLDARDKVVNKTPSAGLMHDGFGRLRPREPQAPRKYPAFNGCTQICNGSLSLLTLFLEGNIWEKDTGQEHGLEA